MDKLYSQWRLFEVATKDDIKNLKFGELTKPKMLRRLSEKPKYIDIDVSDIPSVSFPANDSEEVKKELEYVTRQMSTFDSDGWTDDDMELTDQKPFDIFSKLLDERGVDYDDNFLREIYEDVARVIIKLKVLYNRPRPEQLGPLLGFDFSALRTTTDNTPAFPSGHTTQAWTMAHYLSEQHPELKSDLFDVARKIEMSRVVRGAHYPSDNVFAKYIAKHHLAPNIKKRNTKDEKLET